MTERTRFVKLTAKRRDADYRPVGDVHVATRAIELVWADTNGTSVQTGSESYLVAESVAEVLAAIAGADGVVTYADQPNKRAEMIERLRDGEKP